MPDAKAMFCIAQAMVFIAEAMLFIAQFSFITFSSFVFFMSFFDLVPTISFTFFAILSPVSIVSCVVQFFILLAICRLLFLLFPIPFSLFSIVQTRHSQLINIFLKPLTLLVFIIIMFSSFAEKSSYSEIRQFCRERS